MTPKTKPALYDLSIAQIEALLRDWGLPPFRARQIYRQLYVNKVAGVDDMTDLPLSVRQRLAAETTMGSLNLKGVHQGDHGLTRKALFAMEDGSPVESVLMVYKDADSQSGEAAPLRSTRRATVCVSSQSGCPMACVFCATGKLGFLHDLTAGQIVEQVMWAEKELQKIKRQTSEVRDQREKIRISDFGFRHLTNVVFMGMGEPFNNYDNWWAAVEQLHDPKGYNMGARSFTVSTVGLVPGILRLSQEKLPINLAISLHAPDDHLRTDMMPVNKRYPIAELIAATRTYTERTGRRVSFEYVLLKEKNDFPEQAAALAQLLRPPKLHPLLCHVNLIPWNPVPGTPLDRSDRRRVLAFQEVLQKHHVACTVRVERGVRIGAACGQLAGAA